MPNNNFEVKELLRSQVTNRDPDRLLEILQSEAHLINLKDLTKLDSDGNSALHFALAVKHYELLQLLIEKHPRLQLIKNLNGKTAYAVLVDSMFSTNGESSLARWALDDKKIKLLKFLLDKPNLIPEDAKSVLYKPSVFHTLLFHNENELLKKVIGLAIDANKESIIFTPDKGNWDAREKYTYVLRNFISVAAKLGNLSIVKFLLEAGVDPNVYEYGFAYGVSDITHSFLPLLQPLLQLVIKAIGNTKAADKKKSLYAIRDSLITATFIDRNLRGKKIDFQNYRYEVLQHIWLQLISLPCTDANKQNRDDTEARFRDYLYHVRQKPFYSNFNSARESDPDLYWAYLLLDTNLFVESAYNFNLALTAYMQYLQKGGREYSKLEDVIKQRSSEFLKKDPGLVDSLFLYYRQKGGKHFLAFCQQIVARKDIPGLQGYITCFAAFQNYQNAIKKPIEGINEIIIQDRESFDRSIKTIKAFAKNGLNLASFLLSEISAYNFVMEKESEDGCIVVEETAEVDVSTVMAANLINEFLYAVASAREKISKNSVVMKNSMLYPFSREKLCRLSGDKTLQNILITSLSEGKRVGELFNELGPVSITENADNACTLVFKESYLELTINSEQRKHILQSFQDAFSQLESKDNALLYGKVKNAITQLSLSQEVTQQVQPEIVADQMSNPAPVQIEAPLDQIPVINAAFSEIDKLADKIEGRSQVTHRSLEQENLGKPVKDGSEDVLLKEEIVTSATAPTLSELAKGPDFTLLNLVERDFQLAFLQSPKTEVRYSRDLTELADLMSFNEPGARLNVESSIPDTIPVLTLDLTASISTGSKLATQAVSMLPRIQEKRKDDASETQEKDKDRMVSVKLPGKVGFFKESNLPAVPTHEPAKDEMQGKKKRVAQRAN